MSGALHFLAMAGLGLATLITVARGFGAPSWRRVAASSGVAFASLFVGVFFLHGCDAGAPLTQWSVGVGCAASAVLFVRDPKPRRWLTVGALLVMLGLCAHFTVAVHGDTWIGNPASFSLDAPAHAEWHTWLTGLYRR